MKTNRFAFNVIGLLVAGLFALAALSTVFVVMPGVPVKDHGWWRFLATTEAIGALTVGGGSLVNLTRGRRLDPWPTGIMIVGYLVTIWLFPLAIWGIVSLIVERKCPREEPAIAEA